MNYSGIEKLRMMRMVALRQRQPLGLHIPPRRCAVKPPRGELERLGAVLRRSVRLIRTVPAFCFSLMSGPGERRHVSDPLPR